MEEIDPEATRSLSQPVDGGLDYDAYSWAVSLGVTVDQLRQAISEVGHSAAAVRRRLAER